MISFSQHRKEFVARSAEWQTVPGDQPLANALGYSFNDNGEMVINHSYDNNTTVSKEDIVLAVRDDNGEISSVLFQQRSAVGEPEIYYALALRDSSPQSNRPFTYFAYLGTDSDLTIADYEGFRNIVASWVDHQ